MLVKFPINTLAKKCVEGLLLLLLKSVGNLSLSLTGTEQAQSSKLFICDSLIFFFLLQSLF